MNDIRAMIRERGMTLESVAWALQLTTNTLRAKLNGEVEFRLCEAKTLATMLDTSVDALFFENLGDQKTNTVDAINERLKKAAAAKKTCPSVLRSLLEKPVCRQRFIPAA